MKTTLYTKVKTGKIQQWEIWVEEKGESGFPEVWVRFGLLDGKKQTTFDIVSKGMNIGKSNETTPLQQANLEMERMVTKQLDDGYFRTIEDAKTEQTINFDEPLSKNLCFYKPKNSIDEAKIKKLEKEKRLLKFVKRDGMCHIIRKSKKFGLEIYSRRMDLVTDGYPHLVKAFEDLPNNTILLGEIILNDNGKDNFNKISKICRSKPDQMIARQKEFGNVSYYIYDVPFYEGNKLYKEKKYLDRIDVIKKIVKASNSKFVNAVEQITLPHDDALKLMKARGLEGLVLWDADGIMSDLDCFTFNGKANRPNIVFKSKPIYEDDFIVRWNPEKEIGDYGSGKNKNKIKNVFIYQLDEDGNEVYLGKCGGGLSDEQRAYYTETTLFPRVWRIEYSAIQPGTGSLRFPVFNADRTLSGDKEIKECIMSDAIKEARKQEAEEEEDEE